MFDMDSNNGASQFRLDDGSGLRVVDAAFQGESKFDWPLFDGFDSIRILTYSAGISAIVRLLDRHDFKVFECVFGCEATLRNLKEVLAYQQIAIGDTRAAIKNLPDARHALVLRRVSEGQARFRVLRKSIAHAKLYLLENSIEGRYRIIVGSANLSETAFGGKQSETLVKFDDDPDAWEHYVRQYEEIRNNASDEIELPSQKIVRAEIRLDEVPALNPNDPTTLVIDTPKSDEVVHIPVVERIESLVAGIPSQVSAVIPVARKGRQSLTPQARKAIHREVSRVRIVHSANDVNTRHFSLDRDSQAASLSGEPYSLVADLARLRADARLLIDYFSNYQGTFEGDVPQLQRDYFMLWSWLYFSPFMCEARSQAISGGDVFRYPSFAIVYGKSNCGKSSLVDTLVTSMFGRVYSVDKGEFVRTKLLALQRNYKRLPVVFDDIGAKALNTHGNDFIKNENPPPVPEHPCFILSMNKEQKGVPDEIVKRSMMIYTTTALPVHKEELRNKLHIRIQAMRRELGCELYRAYLRDAIRRLATDGMPEDWLEFSSTLICDLIIPHLDGEQAPDWLRPARWSEYAAKRYDRVRNQLLHLLRPSERINSESSAPVGWTLEDDKVIVIEQTDTFGRRPFDWDNVPSTLIDENASVGGRTVLNLHSLEEFLEVRLSRRNGGIRDMLLKIVGR